MINYINGDLLSVKEGIIAHGCNAQRTMGSGVALAIKVLYPKAYLSYIDMPQDLGAVDLVKVTDKLTIANCITQEFYGRDPNRVYVDYGAVEEAMEFLAACPEQVNLPKIGAGLANGDWNIISGIIDKHFGNRQVNIWCL